jgi:magnesium-transporting ATPase (P-type)
MILTDDNFASIVNAIEEGRAVYANIKKFTTYIFTSNFPEAVPFVAFVFSAGRIPLPLTVMQILAVDLGTDVLPALALGAEKPDPDVMGRPPRRRADGLLGGGLLLRAYLFLGVFEALGGMSAFFFVLLSGGWSWGEALPWADPLYRQATTACLIAIVVMQVVNLFLCRSERVLGNGRIEGALTFTSRSRNGIVAPLLMVQLSGNVTGSGSPLNAEGQLSIPATTRFERPVSGDVSATLSSDANLTGRLLGTVSNRDS